MKFTKIKLAFASAVAVFVSLAVFATGPTPINSPQSGVITFTNGNALIITNQFPVGFTYPPVMQFYLVSGVSNCIPITNNFVTTTNFAISPTTTVATGTNCAIAWNAFIGYPRVQIGTNLTLAGVSTNISFPVAYAQIPIVNVEGSSTNASSQVAVTAVTTTNFTVNCDTSISFIWGSFGMAFTPGPTTVTY